MAQGATKRAVQFELQRHVRRLKQATEPAEVAVLEKELGFLKIVNTRDLGIRALRTKLVKGRLIPKASQMNDASRFPLWPFVQDAELHKDPTLLTDKQSERVLHQVLSSKGLAEELTTAVQSLQSIVAPGRPHTKTTAESENQAVTVAELDNRENGLPAQGDSAAKAKSLAKEAAEAEPNDVENEYSSDDGFGGAAMEHSDKNLDAMVASASDSEDGYDDESEQASDSGSTFLPSLSTGFIPAAAGDDWSDAEADFADEGGGPAKSTRKNRRGQRERRAIWEKKFGRQANHLKLRERENPKRRNPRKVNDKRSGVSENSAHGAPKRVTESDAYDKPAKRRLGASASSSMPVSGTTSIKHSQPKRSSEVTQAIHPSWAAKQRAKEAQQFAQPIGTKIVFD